MSKYYRVKKDTFMWRAGAIIKSEDIQNHATAGYVAVEDIWNFVPNINNEYISARIIEDTGNAEWFERVYPDTISGKLYRTKDQLMDLYNDSFKK